MTGDHGFVAEHTHTTCTHFLSQNPELVKRLEKIKREQEQKEYDKMVANIDNSVSSYRSCISVWSE